MKIEKNPNHKKIKHNMYKFYIMNYPFRKKKIEKKKYKN